MNYADLKYSIHHHYKHKRVYTWDEYLELIEAVAIKFGKPHALKDYPNGRFYLRHDVDRDIVNAVILSNREHRAGMQSTYFFLHTSDYYKEGVYDEIKKIALYHEVGIHNDAITCYYKRNESIPTDKYYASLVFRQVIEEFSQNVTHPFGTSSHGDTKYCKKHGYANYDLFKPEWGDPISSYGLSYEAYSLNRDIYMSDSGGMWSVGYDTGAEETGGNMTIREMIDRVNGSSYKRPLIAMMLCHPLYYFLEGRP